MTEQVNRPADMIDNANLGTWMNWSDIVKRYPDRWVYITDYKIDDTSNVIGGILRVVCREPEFAMVEDILTDKSKKGYLGRTTELPGNILWVE